MSETRPFVHLHCHSAYSMLDGANRLDDLIEKVSRTGMNAVAITDHGNLYGAFEFYNKCRARGVNPIVGYEAYVAPGQRTDRRVVGQRETAYHLTLLAMNRTGYYNLIKLASIAYLEGFYYKPRIDKEVLQQYSEGLICLSGCAASELSHLILAEKMDEAEQLAAWYHRVFGDRFYMEIQNCGLDIQRRCMEGTVDLANRMGLPLVATNDAHYLNREDAKAHDALLCINTRALRDDKNRMRYGSDEFYVKTPEEMYAAFPGFEDAVARTQEIADRVDIQLEKNPKHYPVFHPPEGKTDTQYLRELCLEGLKRRYGDEVTEEHYKRLDYELDVIDRMGYSSYFLIVWDFVRFAQENNIPCGARGSACGALVSYVLGLSHVCPLKYDLLFERFLDPSRAEPPDIDIDFCRDRRQLVIEYTKQKYGEANVAQIGTFNTLKARAAIRDVGRVLGVPLARVNQIAKYVPERPGVRIEDALEESPELKHEYDTDPQVQELIDIAIRLQGLPRNAGTHAAGVVVGDKPLDNYLPLQTITGKTDIITQWDGPHVEKAGLLKMDFLGLRNLTILDKAVQNVKKSRGIEIDPTTLPLDDPETYALLQRGETKGIFQFEGGGIRNLLTQMRPDCFNDIIATSALYRPGPLEGGMVADYVDVKHGRKEMNRVHPLVDEILEETYGVMVYQEQVMRILNRVGGIELPAAYRCIKAISKKKAEVIEAFREQYIQGARARGIDEEVARRLFELIEKFAGYGFNKSHSTAYGAVSYQTAYFKAHYPVEFMAALLSCEMESTDRIAEHIEDARRMGIEIVPPDINRSEVEFAVDGNRVLFGLGALKGIGQGVLSAIVAERENNGPYRDLFDLTARVDPKLLNRAALEVLIKANALRSLPGHQAQQMAALDRAIQLGVAQHRDRKRGQKSLFGDLAEADGSDSTSEELLPEVPEWTNAQRLAAEKEAYGFYLTSHPFAQIAARIRPFTSHRIEEVAELDAETEVVVAGMISAVNLKSQRNPSRNNNTRYAHFDLEDDSGVIRCTIFADNYARYGGKVKQDTVVVLKGRVERRGREPTILVDQLLTPDEASRELTGRITIRLRRGLHDETHLQRLRTLLNTYRGRTSVVLLVESSTPDATRRVAYTLGVPATYSVCCTPQLLADLSTLLGPDAFRLHPAVSRGTRSHKIGRLLDAPTG
ncbi:MAG: DNA polymerase III subunit alpha [Planctomycetota bacterium]|nr:MAG: DNA polymerase III subunit alpha [Planctomycetota bacterium]